MRLPRRSPTGCETDDVASSIETGRNLAAVSGMNVRHNSRVSSNADTGSRGRSGHDPLPRSTRLAALITSAVLMLSSSTGHAQIPVRHAEGLVHGFLALRTLEGSTIADGDLIQSATGARVSTRLVFHFKDGSLYDETAIYSQRRSFRLISDHMVQKGPSFPEPIDMSIDAVKGQVTVRYTTDKGEEKVESQHLDVPANLANGIVLTLLKNADPKSPPEKLGFVAATPKPRLVKLAVSTAGEESFSTGGTGRKAMHYIVKVEVGGLAGVVAPLVGKQPPDSHVWILGGPAPAFVKAEQPLFNGGPVWRIELVSPAWPHTSADER
jgi:hypothetical protein